MSNQENQSLEAHLKVFLDRSIFVDKDGSEIIFQEGKITQDAKERNNQILRELNDGFFERVIEECNRFDSSQLKIAQEDIELLDRIVDSLTSERGRALVGLTIIQLCIKSINNDQSIRLHKATSRGDSFSWEQGISMRSIDNQYITPVLRKFNLLKVNKDGVMMTRSLAENYPYTKLYKASIRGAMQDWLEIVDRVEKGILNAKAALQFIILALRNRADEFINISNATQNTLDKYFASSPSFEEIKRIIKNHIDKSEYSARLMEIALHSLFQVKYEHGLTNGILKPLSQMRSANKKHGNIGDIEIVSESNAFYILESWDAKYGKPYLREELEELSEKLETHPETEIAGFVVDKKPDIRKDIANRIDEISSIHGTKIYLISFDEFIDMQLQGMLLNPLDTAKEWLTAYAGSLAQKKRDLAPIDEPCHQWLEELIQVLLLRKSG